MMPVKCRVIEGALVHFMCVCAETQNPRSWIRRLVEGKADTYDAHIGDSSSLLII